MQIRAERDSWCSPTLVASLSLSLSLPLLSSPRPFYHISSSSSNIKKMRPAVLPLLGLILIFSVVAAADLQVGFYNSTCPQAESIVREVIHKDFQVNPMASWIIRLYFHDCFHTGCDASVLIQGKPDNHQAEWAAHANRGLNKIFAIDDAKSKLENQCPHTVSCADILALATREAVVLASAGAINYSVPTGRRDGLSSDAATVVLPDANITVADSVKLFNDKNLTMEDMVTLLGAHSIGGATCDFFRDRMFSYNGKNGTSDPHMDSALKARLSDICGTAPEIPDRIRQDDAGGDVLQTFEQSTRLDQGEPSFLLDNKYYGQLLAKRAVLQVDQELIFDDSTAPIVARYASDATLFNQKFAEAMIKLGNVGVLVGDQGEIRTVCSRFNRQKM